MLFYHLLPGYPKADLNKLVEQFIEKCSLASELLHPNVEHFIKISHIGIPEITHSGIPVIITELLTENLTIYLSCTDSILDYDRQLSLCSDMAQGLEYLHSHQLIHGNLYGNNVLITHDHHAKIADYLCPLLLTDVTTDNSFDYWAPETLKHKSITFQSNVFTLAVLFLEVFAKHPPRPRRDVNISELEQRSSDLSRISENHLLLSLIQKCLSHHEAERPQLADICKHLIQNKVSLIKMKENFYISQYTCTHICKM